MSNITNDFEYEAIEKSPMEDEIQEQKQLQTSPDLPKSQTNDKNSEIDLSQNTDKSEPEKKTLGFFATLGLAWLSVTNNAIGGAPIEVDNIKLMDVKSMDELIVNEIIDSGKELDAKYFNNMLASPEMRYGMSMGFFYMIRGRFRNVKEWFKAHRNKDKKE